MTAPETPRGRPAAAGPRGTGRRQLGGVLVVVSLFVLFFAFRSHSDINNYDPSAAPMCGDEVMTPRDTCWFAEGDGSYEGQKDEAAKQHRIDLWIRDIGFIASPALFVGGILLIVWGTRRVRAARQPVQE
ncbi:hypothetical protein GCM10009779_02120 [Polymorphospora rubra]|uniref:Uncharacterized protein n=1 Tax=Polymorphospora rubra TaxID=338584 RepID=A0A810N2H8_9ACTN|nr:hypothetical protein Prubr_27660 [Polymorphospora rubra]